MDTHLAKAGLDSSTLVQLHSMLEFHYGVPLTPALLLDTPSVRLIAGVLVSKLQHGGTTTSEDGGTDHGFDSVQSGKEDAGECWEHISKSKDEQSMQGIPAPLVQSAIGNDWQPSAGNRYLWQKVGVVCMWAMVLSAALASMLSMTQRTGPDGEPLNWCDPVIFCLRPIQYIACRI